MDQTAVELFVKNRYLFRFLYGSDKMVINGAETDVLCGGKVIAGNIYVPVKDIFDYILIDCPPSLGLITLNAFTASDSVLIPVQCEYFALEGLGQLINTVNLVKRHLNKNIEIEGALLTMYDIRTNLSNQVVKEVKKYFNDKVYKTVIPRNVRLSEAPSYGMPITEYDPKSKGAKSYEKFTREFLKINDEEQKAKQM